MNFHASNSEREVERMWSLSQNPRVDPKQFLDRNNACLVDGTARRRSGLEKTPEGLAPSSMHHDGLA
jgi:hypothetical protein